MDNTFNGTINTIEDDFNGIDYSSFQKIVEVELIVPENYDHATQLSKLNPKEFHYFDRAIQDKKFKNTSNKLVPNKKYVVKIFQLKKTVRSEDCIKFLKGQKAVLVSAQGLSLFWCHNKELFPNYKWTVSFDEKNNLFKYSKGDHGVPRILHYPKNESEFDLGYFEGGRWHSGYCLLSFCEKI